MTATPLSRLQACALRPHYAIPKRSDLQWMLAEHERMRVCATRAESLLSAHCRTASAQTDEIVYLRDTVEALTAERDEAKATAYELRDRPTWASLWLALSLSPVSAFIALLIPHG